MIKKSIQRSLWAAPCLAVAMGFAATSAQAVTIFALTDDGTPTAPPPGVPPSGADNMLISFDSATPGTLLSGPTPITGLIGAAELVLGIDFRATDGMLYATTFTDRVYTIDPATGIATAVNTTPFGPGLENSSIGMDFNPVSSAIRAIGLTQNSRLALTPTTVAQTVNVDAVYAAGDPNAGVTSLAITSAAYENDDTDATTATTLYGIDRANDAAPGTAGPLPANGVLVRIGSVGGTPNSPDTGLLSTIGALGFRPLNNNVGFDINTVGGVNTAYAAFTNTTTGVTGLYTVDLATGAATLVGPIGAGTTQVAGIAVVPAPAALASLQFSAPDFPVGEAAGMATVTVTRTGDMTGTLSATVATVDGDGVTTPAATAGSDYTTTSMLVTFAPGVETATVDIPITPDTLTESPSETFTVTLTGAPGTTTGLQDTATVTIADDDTAGMAGTLQLGAPDFAITEDDGMATFTVTRMGGMAGEATVAFTTADVTAMAGADYTTTSGILTFADGDAATQSVTIPILNDTDQEPAETFTVTLGTATGATLGMQATSTVTIAENDVPPVEGTGTLQLSAADFPVNESDGTVTVTVTRTAGTTGPATVDFATSAGAADTADFTATTGTLNFAEGETTMTFPVTILNDDTTEGAETFNVTLSGATGAALGTQTTSTVTIAASDDDNGGGGDDDDNGGGDGGCSLSPMSDGKFDPTLPLMTLFAGMYLLRRKLGWKA